MVALIGGQTEHPLLQYRIGAVPQRERKTQPLLVVADSRDAVLAPTISARARVIMRKIFPRRSVRAVILAHGSPLPLA